MEIAPLSVASALEFLVKHERHYKTEAEPIFAIGLSDGNAIRGAVIVGKNESFDAAIAHIYSDGEYQGYTLLYGAAVRAAKALGYERMIL